MSRWAGLRLVAMIVMTLCFFLAGALMWRAPLGCLALISVGAICNVIAHGATMMDISTGRARRWWRG